MIGCGLSKAAVLWRPCRLARFSLPSRCCFSTTNVANRQPAQEESKENNQLSKTVLEEVLLSEKTRPTTTAGKIKEKGQNTLLYSVALASVCGLGYFFYIMGDTIFGADSPTRIFSQSLSLINSDYRCEELFGSGIKGFGEGKRRRNHVANHKYEKDGEERVRVLYHIKGDIASGTVQCEMKKTESGWDYRYLFVETTTGPRTTHVLIDNRI